MKKGLYSLLPLAGLLMAGTSFMAIAANFLTMKATLAEGTCIIEGGLDKSIVFEPLAKFTGEKKMSSPIKFSGCPGTHKKC